MKAIFIFTIILFKSVSLYGQHQNSKDLFNYQIRKVIGDLNRDGFRDIATISMDTIHETRPLKLEVFLSLPNGKSKLFFSTTTMIQAMYPVELNGEYNGNQIPYVYIKEGKLRLEFDINGNSTYDFKFKNGVFELIYFTHVTWDGKNIIETAFNLLTGKYTKQSEIHETSEIIKTTTGALLIKPLPQLKKFKPFECILY